MGGGPHARPPAQGRGPGDHGQASLSGRFQKGSWTWARAAGQCLRGRRGAPPAAGSLPGHTCWRTPGGPVTVSGRVSGRLYRHVRSPHPHCRQPGRQGPGTPRPPPGKLGSPLRLVGGPQSLQRPPPSGLIQSLWLRPDGVRRPSTAWPGHALGPADSEPRPQAASKTRESSQIRQECERPLRRQGQRTPCCCSSPAGKQAGRLKKPACGPPTSQETAWTQVGAQPWRTGERARLVWAALGGN